MTAFVDKTDEINLVRCDRKAERRIRDGQSSGQNEPVGRDKANVSGAE